MMFNSFEIHIQFERFVNFSNNHGISSPEGRFGGGFFHLFGNSSRWCTSKRDTAKHNASFVSPQITTSADTCRITHIMRRMGCVILQFSWMNSKPTHLVTIRTHLQGVDPAKVLRYLRLWDQVLFVFLGKYVSNLFGS